MKKHTRRDFLNYLCYLPALAILPQSFFNLHSTSKAENIGIMNIQNPDKEYLPPYLKLHKSGELKERGKLLWNMMSKCDICPRECYTNRLSGRRGDCNANSSLEISSAYPHFGEEPELVGAKGSGTIFMTNCSLLCVFCINYDVSQKGQGRQYEISELADMMISLQNMQASNINIVSPTHYAPHILLALDIAAKKGLKLPLVYNTSGWEKVNILKFFDNVVDIYLTDFKYMDNDSANKYSIGAKSYPEDTQAAILEMQRQVGSAKPNSRTGLINRGLMIRHLVMPNNVCRTDLVLNWIAKNLPKDTYINIMSQYTPVFKASEYPEISRRITISEYRSTIKEAQKAGLTNIKTQSD